MKFFFCNGCGKRITEKDVTRGEARDKKLKGVFCTECAVGITTVENVPLTEAAAKRLLGKKPSGESSVVTSSGPSSFYFCEKCGTRLTEEDIKQGQARDKKLKGVYCAGCAEGVLTMEFNGLTSEEAQELVAGDKTTATDTTPKKSSGVQRGVGRRSTRSRIPAPARSGSRAAARGPISKREFSEATKRSAAIPIAVGVGITFLLFALVVVFMGGDKSAVTKRSKKGTRKKPVAESVKESTRKITPAPKAAPPTTEARKPASTVTEVGVAEPNNPVPQPDSEEQAPEAPTDSRPEPTSKTPSATSPTEPPKPDPEKLFPDGPNLVAHWKLDEGKGGVVADASGNGITGRFFGMGDQNWTDPAPGAKGSTAALLFKGGRQWVDMPAHEKLSLDSYTIAIWIRFSERTRAWQCVLEHDRMGPNWFGLFRMPRCTRVHFVWDRPCRMNGVSNLPLAKWHHIAATHDQATRTGCIYVNGLFHVKGSGGSSRGNLARFRLGASLEGREGFRGAIDDVRVYDGALTAAQIKMLMGGVPEASPPEASPPKASPPKPVLSKEEKEQLLRNKVMDALVDGVILRLQDRNAPIAKVLEETGVPEEGEPFAEDARKLLSDVVAKLVSLRADREKALKALAGKRVLIPSVGRSPVEIIEVAEGRIKLKKFFRLNNEERSRVDSIAFEKLKPTDWKRLYTPPELTEPLGWSAGLVRQLANKDVDGAQKSLAKMKGHALEPHLSRAVDRARLGALEADAGEMLGIIAKKAQDREKLQPKAFLALLRSFEKKYGSTKAARDRRADIDGWLDMTHGMIERQEGMHFDFKTMENARRFLQVFKIVKARKFKILPGDSKLVFKRTEAEGSRDDPEREQGEGVWLQAKGVKLGTAWELEYRIRTLCTRESMEKHGSKYQKFNLCFVESEKKLLGAGEKQFRLNLRFNVGLGGRLYFGFREPDPIGVRGNKERTPLERDSKFETMVTFMRKGDTFIAPSTEDGTYHIKVRMMGDKFHAALNGKEYDVLTLKPKDVERISKSVLTFSFLDKGFHLKNKPVVGEETDLKFFRFRVLE